MVTAPCPASAQGQPPVQQWVAPLEQGHPLAGRIWQPAEGTFLTPEGLVERLAAARFVLLGEKHDNPDHHRLQAWLLRELVAHGRRPAVAFEMIDNGQAAILADYRDKDAAGLGPALNWEANGWPDWALYRPIAQAALDAGLPIVTANLPRDQVRAIVRGGAAPTDPGPLPQDLADEMSREIRDSHCGQLPDKAVPGMVMVQRVRDAVMAEAMERGAAMPGSDGAVLIAGAGHVRADRGVPMQLRRSSPQAAMISIAFVEATEGRTDPAAYGEVYGGTTLPYDAVWFTARLDDTDPCAALAGMKKGK